MFVLTCLLRSTNTQTLSYSHSSPWAWVTPRVTPCDHLCSTWAPAGLWKSMGWASGFLSSLPQKMKFFERRRMALAYVQYLHSVTPFETSNEHSYKKRKSKRRLTMSIQNSCKTHELSYVCVETRKGQDIAISRASAGTNTNKLCPRSFIC